MTAEEGRALFDAAYDGELDAETRGEFEALLAHDQSVRSEYESFRVTMARTRALNAAPPVDLLSGVQDKLRARSGGRFYRDRFATQRGRSPKLVWMIVLSVAVLLAFAIFAASYVVTP
jgi:anti-sigma factor RsiW